MLETECVVAVAWRALCSLAFATCQRIRDFDQPPAVKLPAPCIQTRARFAEKITDCFSALIDADGRCLPQDVIRLLPENHPAPPLLPRQRPDTNSRRRRPDPRSPAHSTTRRWLKTSSPTSAAGPANGFPGSPSSCANTGRSPTAASTGAHGLHSRGGGANESAPPAPLDGSPTHVRRSGCVGYGTGRPSTPFCCGGLILARVAWFWREKGGRRGCYVVHRQPVRVRATKSAASSIGPPNYAMRSHL